MERRGLLPEMISVLAPPQNVAISSITASELLVGLHRAADSPHHSKRERFVEAILSAFPIVPFDLEIARVHVRLMSELMARGRLIGSHDLVIGTTAVAIQYDLLTDNRRDFDRIADLAVFTPTWDRID